MAIDFKRSSVSMDELEDTQIGETSIAQNDQGTDVFGEKETLSYEKSKTGIELEAYVEDIAESVRLGLDQSISILTPWFFKNMPSMYYQTTPRAEKVRHLSTIISGHVFETKQTAELWDRDRSKVTFIGPGGDRKILVDMARKLNTSTVKMGSVYFSRDKLLFLSTFFCNDRIPLDLANPRISEKIQATRKLLLREFPDDAGKIDAYIKSLDNDFVMYATVGRLHITYRMNEYMNSHEGAHTILEPMPDSHRAKLTFAVKGVQIGQLFDHVIQMIHRYGFNIGRAFVVSFDQGQSDPVAVMHFMIEQENGEKVVADTIPLMRLNKALRTLGWVDVDEYSLLSTEPYGYSINATNLVRAIASWTNVFLGKNNPYYYSSYKIQTTYFKYTEILADLITLFRIKFDPLKAEERNAHQFEGAKQALLRRIEDLGCEEIERNILKEAVNFVDHTLKTNYFLPTKTGLAFRLSPAVLDKNFYQHTPFGIFFIIGRDYRAFHVRWRDISRGGLRVVMPRNPSDYDFAIAGIFDEVYGLSFAQQLKNKDIPEGGSKAVLVLKPGGHRQRAVRGAVNALLDLLVSDDESHEGRAAQQISYYNKEEVIYLGPDENITNDLIEWIPEQARRRGYRYALAFMSSKPGAGINHKEYGVTSEGLNVYVDNALHFLGIDSRKPFTVKLTGGPDGDVAGNELKILHREYGENAKVVAIADGFGAAYDPKGLNWGELLSLYKNGKPIAEFNPSKLSGANGGFVIKADTKENRKIRDELAGKTEVDVFIPAGGRPYTVNEKNWQGYLLPNGNPTMKAIVEGANIFFTSEARLKLQDKGVLIFKDSSANKAGVICSSFEIIASLTLSVEEFLAFKDEYVREVLDILRSKADSEAKLLLKEYSQHAGAKTLVQLSMDISREINDVTDILLDELAKREEEVQNDPIYQALLFRHCPKILVKNYPNRILERLPVAHKIAILSAYIASYVVYREGLGWFEQLPKGQRVEAAKTYMKQDQLTYELIAALEQSDIANKDKIVAIMKMSAARDLTLLDLRDKYRN